MKVKTRLFGEISVADDKVIYFENGIIGFPAFKHFAVVHDVEKPDAAVMWLQSLDEGEFAMPVLLPSRIMPDYAPSVDESMLDVLGDYDVAKLMMFTTLTVPAEVEKMTVNLKAPIIVNNDNLRACQLIAENEEYPVRYPIYDILQQGKAGEK